MDITLEQIIDILTEIEEDVDYESRTDLVDSRALDSFDILKLISALEEELDVSVPAKDVVPENFNSASAILALVQRLAEED